MAWNSDLPPVVFDTAQQRRHARAPFDAHAEAIRDEWYRRQSERAGRRAESPNAWFKREAYRLLTRYIEAGRAVIFDRNIKNFKWSVRVAESASNNPFKLGLLAMFSDEDQLTRNNRLVFGNQMLYAWVHDVPPEFLNAFLAISGRPAEIAVKLKAGHVEPGFEARFRPERLPRTDG